MFILISSKVLLDYVLSINYADPEQPEAKLQKHNMFGYIFTVIDCKHFVFFERI